MLKNFMTVTANASYPVRHEELMGRSQIVVPVVALVEGVHNGSLGRAFYSAEEIAKFPGAWNGRPTPVFHPINSGGDYISANSPSIISKCPGQVFNATIDDGKLKAEIWLDEQMTREKYPDLLVMIQNKVPVEISTGLFSEHDNTPGVWREEQYDVKVINIRPDHIALLPGKEGACSLNDGCGIRANSAEFYQVVAYHKAREIYVSPEVSTNEMSHEEIGEQLKTWANKQDGNNRVNWISSIYQDYFIHEVMTIDPANGTRLGSNMYKRGYSFDDNGQVVISDKSEEVVEQTDYIPIAASESKTSTIKEKEMKKDQLIKILMECPCTRFGKDEKTKAQDEVWLNTLSEDQLEKLRVPDDVLVKVNAADEAAKKAKEVAPPVVAEKKPTREELLSNLKSVDPEYSAIIDESLAARAATKSKLVDNIVASKSNKFEKVELDAMSLPHLKKLATLAEVEIPEHEFVGNAGGGSPSDAKVPDMPSSLPEKK
jgi:hypothetical protein